MTVETHVTNLDRVSIREVVLAGNCHTEIEFYEQGDVLRHTVYAFGWDRSDFVKLDRSGATGAMEATDMIRSNAWVSAGNTAKNENDYTAFLTWMASVDKAEIEGWPAYVFSDSSYIMKTETYDVVIGNLEDSFDTLIDAAKHLWDNHSKFNVLG